MTKIFGILNITPDSFSDGGDFLSPKKAVHAAQRMIQEGADIIDIGAESTAPDNKKISHEEEWQRLEKIFPALREKNLIKKISLDSYKSKTWEKFLELGGEILNDVSGLETDQEEKIFLLKKYPQAKVILMFSQDISQPDPKNLEEIIMKDIKKFFTEKILLLQKNGIEKSRIILDPGMGGFLSTNPKISFEVIARLKELEIFNCQILVGTSRKSFLREVSHPTDPTKRKIASVVSGLLAVQNGANFLRVHDVVETREGLDTLEKTL